MIVADVIQQINCNASGLSVHIVHDYKLFHKNKLHTADFPSNCFDE